MTYLGNISLKIKNILKKHTNIAFKISTSVNTLLNNGKDKKDPLNNTGVYKLKCNSCSAVYIGKTDRSFEIRLNEHIRYMKPGTTGFSQFGRHIKENNHSFDKTEGFTILHSGIKGRLLQYWELLEIQKSQKHNKKDTLNNQLNTDTVYTFTPFI